MTLEFERGSRSEPRGHAIIYFRTTDVPEKLLATYVVALPMAMNLGRFLPPLFASYMGGAGQSELSSVALPPMPDEVASRQELERLAALREDDLVFGGAIPGQDLAAAMHAVNDVVAEYSRLWQERAAAAPTAAPSPGESLGVTEVLYSLMSERDKLGELAKVLGRLRFAVEGRDTAAAREAEEEARVLARYLPERYQVEHLLAAARTPTPQGARLAQLYLDRAYALHEEAFERVRALDERIAELERMR